MDQMDQLILRGLAKEMQKITKVDGSDASGFLSVSRLWYARRTRMQK